jgi:ABC-2 type transport system ATP-binding protein
MSAVPQPLVAVDGVVKDYGALRAVDRVSFTLDAGKVVAVLGPNGSGKTSLFRMLVGFNRPDHGAIRYVAADGRTHDVAPPAELGYMPEERGLYPDAKVADVIAYFGQLRGAAEEAAHVRATVLLKELDIAQHAGKRVKELSKGNQQKVQLATCLVNDPRLVVLDEPFSGLDPLNQESLLDYLGEVARRGTGIVLSAHHLQLVERLADSALILSRGAVVAEHHGRSPQRASQRIAIELADGEGSRDAGLALERAGAAKTGERTYEFTGDIDAQAAETIAALVRSRALAALRTGEPSLRDTFFSALDGVRKESVQ